MNYKLLLITMLMITIVATTVTSVPPTWYEDSLQTNTSTSGDIIVNAPIGMVEGDLIIILVHDRDTPTITPPSGVTLINSYASPLGNDNMLIAAYYLTATNSTPNNFSFTRSTNRDWYAASIRVTGYDETTPIGAVSGVTSDGSGVAQIIIPSITTSNVNSLLVASITAGQTINNPQQPSGMDVLYSQISDRPSSITSFQTITAQGLTGTKTYSWDNNRRVSAMMFEIISSDDEMNGGGGGGDGEGGVFTQEYMTLLIYVLIIIGLLLLAIAFKHFLIPSVFMSALFIYFATMHFRTMNTGINELLILITGLLFCALFLLWAFWEGISVSNNKK